MKPAQALLLDLSETLIDGSVARESISRTCEAIAANRSGLDAATLVEANTKIWPGYWREVGDRWDLGQIDSLSLCLEAWRRTLRACGCNDESVAQLATNTLLKLSRNGYRLFDDVTDLLATARRAGVPLGLITNGAADAQREKLRVLDLERCFDVVVISGEVGIAKPDASIFRLALGKLAAERESAWHVGDDLNADVAGARAAGITAVWLNRRGLVRKHGEPEPDLEIRSLSSLVPYFSE
jgi:putative hydrolase of the HAD superfamily